MGFELNVIVLAACFAGVYLIASNSRDRIRTLDLVVALAFLGLVTLPIYALSWVAVTGLSLYILLFANDGSERRRGALILLALAGVISLPFLAGNSASPIRFELKAIPFRLAHGEIAAPEPNARSPLRCRGPSIPLPRCGRLCRRRGG